MIYETDSYSKTEGLSQALLVDAREDFFYIVPLLVDSMVNNTGEDQALKENGVIFAIKFCLLYVKE